jgi:hypothetical protein
MQNYGLGGLDVRERGDFVTLQPGQSLEIRHEIPRDKIDAAEVQGGEVYRSEITEFGLGTRWWMYGTMDDAGGKKFMGWSARGVEEERQYILDKMKQEYEEMKEDYGEDEGEGEPPGLDDLILEDGSEYIMGEDPTTLGIIIEKGEAEFEVVRIVIR